MAIRVSPFSICRPPSARKSDVHHPIAQRGRGVVRSGTGATAQTKRQTAQKRRAVAEALKAVTAFGCGNAGDNGRTRRFDGRAPGLFGLFSIVTLCAEALSKQGKLGLRKAAWYGKEAAMFTEAIASTNRLIWSAESFQTSVSKTRTIKVPLELFERLTETLCYAA